MRLFLVKKYSGGSFLSLFAVHCGWTSIDGNKTVFEWINGLSTPRLMKMCARLTLKHDHLSKIAAKH